MRTLTKQEYLDEKRELEAKLAKIRETQEYLFYTNVGEFADENIEDRFREKEEDVLSQLENLEEEWRGASNNA